MSWGRRWPSANISTYFFLGSDLKNIISLEKKIFLLVKLCFSLHIISDFMPLDPDPDPHHWNYLTVHSLINNTQHGIMAKRSCATNLPEFLEKSTRIIESGDPRDIIYLDFAKAFDKVPHKCLLNNMRPLGLRTINCDGLNHGSVTEDKGWYIMEPTRTGWTSPPLWLKGASWDHYYLSFLSILSKIHPKICRWHEGWEPCHNSGQEREPPDLPEQANGMGNAVVYELQYEQVQSSPCWP